MPKEGERKGEKWLLSLLLSSKRKRDKIIILRISTPPQLYKSERRKRVEEKERAGTEAINSGIYLWFGFATFGKREVPTFLSSSSSSVYGNGLFGGARVLPLFCSEYIFLRTHVFVRL